MKAMGKYRYSLFSLLRVWELCRITAASDFPSHNDEGHGEIQILLV
jgi:hypothetical protein